MTANRKSRIVQNALLSYAFTFMMIELADAACMLIDGMIVSRSLGSVALASIGLANPAYYLVALLSGVFAIGMQSVCSAAMGAGDSRKISENFTCGSIMLVLIAAVMTILCFAFLHPLCILFGAGSDPELYRALADYLRGFFVGIPGFIGFRMLSPIVTLDGNKKCVTIATVAQSVLNIAGDLFTIRVLHLDTYGVGLSSGITFDIACLILLFNFARKRTSFHLCRTKFSFGKIAEMIRIGSSHLTKYGCKMLAPLLVNRVVIAIGGSAVMAAMSVKTTIANFFLVAGQGIAESVNLLSQVFFSEKDKDALHQVANFALKINILVCTSLAVAQFFCSGWIARAYMPMGTPEYALVVKVLKCFAVSITFNGFNSILLGYLQGTRKILSTNLQLVSHRLLSLALMTFVLGMLFGVDGLFIAIPISEVLALLIYAIVTLTIGRNRDRADALMLLPDDFGYGEDDSIAFNISTIEEAVGISESVGNFCESRGVEHRKAFFASLCLEETVVNIIKHGFKKDKKKHSCDVRVMIENGDVILRIRDDCRFFNMKERYDALDKDDPASHIGIKLAYRSAKEVNYVNLLNTNTLIIRI